VLLSPWVLLTPKLYHRASTSRALYSLDLRPTDFLCSGNTVGSALTASRHTEPEAGCCSSLQLFSWNEPVVQSFVTPTEMETARNSAGRERSVTGETPMGNFLVQLEAATLPGPDELSLLLLGLTGLIWLSVALLVVAVVREGVRLKPKQLADEEPP